MARAFRRVAYGSTLAALGASGVRRGKREGAQTLAGVPLVLAEGESAVEEQFMVSFRQKTRDADIEVFCAQCGQCVFMGHPDEGGIALAVVKGSMQALESCIAARPEEVTFVEQDAYSKLAGGFERDSQAFPSWGIEAVGTRTRSGTGKGVNVYVLDTGIRYTHQEFGGRAFPCMDATSSPPKVCDASDLTCAVDVWGHGTHVAGTVGGATMGVAPQSTLWAMEIGQTMASIYESMDFLAQVEHLRLPAVLSASVGGPRSAVAETAVDALVAASITVVVAAGNENADACEFSPSHVPSAISVGSVDRNLSRSNFSNYGDCLDIWAPGSDIDSADVTRDNRKVSMSGTSMATPHVSGAAALLLEVNPDASPEKIRQALISNSWKGGIVDAKADNYFLKVGSPGAAPSPMPPYTPPPCPSTCVLGLAFCKAFGGSTEDCVNGNCMSDELVEMCGQCPHCPTEI